MSSNKAIHALRLEQAISTLQGADAARSFGEIHPLDEDANPAAKAAWACSVCSALKEQFYAEPAAHILRLCRCGDGKDTVDEILDCIRNAATLTEACARFTEQTSYSYLEYVNDHELIFGYYECLCSCINGADIAVPRLWCECSVGYAEALFRQLFGSTVQATLLQTVKSGDPRCAFRITW